MKVISRVPPVFLFVLASLICTTSIVAQEAAQTSTPPLSEKIRAIIDTDGAVAAERWFVEVYPDEKEGYEADIQTLLALGSEYMQAGDLESGTMVMKIMTTVGQDAMAAAGMTPPEESATSGAVTEADESVKTVPYEQPRARTDLEQFFGVYAEPGQEGTVKGLMVTEMCGGVLYVITTWGDSSPWLMNPVSDTEFEYADNWTSLELEFQPGAGSAGSVEHDLDFLPSPLPRLGPLPEEWQECVPDLRG